MATRYNINDFALGNPAYVGATVSFWTVSGGAKTSTLATLYAASTGSTTLTNPRTLDSDGKFSVPVYTEVPVIATVSGLTIADHDTGIMGLAESAAATSAAAAAASAAAALASETAIEALLFSVTEYGATGDGVTDDTAEIQAAIDAAIALNAGVTLTFPTGTYLISSPLTADNTANASSKLTLRGDGIGATTIKCKAGFAGDHMLRYGPGSSSTTRTTFGGVRDMSFDGNSLATVAALYIRNAYRCVFENLSIDNCGLGDGLYSSGHTTGAAGDPLNQGNIFHNIYSRNNAKAGFYFRGEKSSLIGMCQADDNAEQGFFFDSETVGGTTETTECVIGSLLAKNNTGAGFAFSGIAKYSVGNLEAYINGGPAVHFVATRTGTTVPSVACSFGSIVSRNNLGAVSTAAGANIWLTSSDIGAIVHIGGSGLGTAPVEAEAVKIAGWYAVTIGRINSALNIGTVLRMVDQTGPQYCHTITIGEVMAYSNGNAAATLNHGVSLEGSTSLITIDKLHSQNTYTTAAEASYEVVTAVGVTATINNAYVYAAEAARELSIGNQSLVTLGGTSNIRGVQAERKVTGLAAASAISSYGTYANEFWDNTASIQKYARMGDDSLRLLSAAPEDWTPGITFTTVGDLSVTYTTQTGKSIVVGDVCIAFFTIVTATFTHTTAAGVLRINGLPHAAAATHPDVGSALHAFQGITKANYTQFSPTAIAGTSLGGVAASGSGQAVAELAPADMPTGGSVILRGVLIYKVDLPLT
ncbi:MAG: glycosyl hydrolase family 28-related protein [Caldilineaceae bacterium]